VTKQLILMRHAKSDWGDPMLPDHDRPLNARGRHDAPRMGRWIQQHQWCPDLILSSTATRVVDTVCAMQAEWPETRPYYATRHLYLTSPEGILDVLRGEALEAARVMLVGHNPAIEHLANRWCERPVHFSTAALAVFEWPIEDWQSLTLDREATLVALARPKQLATGGQ
jgi:phosphohistidine phosphatase